MSAEQLDIAVQHFLNHQYQQGLSIAKLCIQQHPSSQTYVNKALFQYRLGHVQQAINDLGQALHFDPLNHHAYFNLFSVHHEQQKYDNAFKNLCCGLSVLHLMLAQNTNNEEHIQKSIDYSFNNKQARALKSIIKLKAGKNIEALNQINYALYLDPSNKNLISIQQKVYKKMGMKELTNQNKPQKAKFDRLETYKEIPSSDKISQVIKQMLAQFNNLMTKISQQGVYITSLTQYQNQHQFEPVTEEPSIRWAQIKKVPDEKHLDDATATQGFRFKQNDSSKSETTNTLNDCSQSFQQQQLFLNNEQSFSKMDSISISNISQNSKVKLSRVNSNHVLDISSCVVSLLEESGSNQILPEDSLDQSRENQKVQLKLPMESIRGLGDNQKLVLAIQRVKTNEKGEKEEVEELYEIVANNKGVELVKSQGNS